MVKARNGYNRIVTNLKKSRNRMMSAGKVIRGNALAERGQNEIVFEKGGMLWVRGMCG